jgi:hypothetical protein
MNPNNNFDSIRTELLIRYNIVVKEYMDFLSKISDEDKGNLIKLLNDEATANKYKDQELKRFDTELKIMSLQIACGKPM